jgi:hypothetical protein
MCSPLLKPPIYPGNVAASNELQAFAFGMQIFTSTINEIPHDCKKMSQYIAVVHRGEGVVMSTSGCHGTSN